MAKRPKKSDLDVVEIRIQWNRKTKATNIDTPLTQRDTLNLLRSILKSVGENERQIAIVSEGQAKRIIPDLAAPLGIKH